MPVVELSSWWKSANRQPVAVAAVANEESECKWCAAKCEGRGTSKARQEKRAGVEILLTGLEVAGASRSCAGPEAAHRFLL